METQQPNKETKLEKYVADLNKIDIAAYNSFFDAARDINQVLKAQKAAFFSVTFIKQPLVDYMKTQIDHSASLWKEDQKFQQFCKTQEIKDPTEADFRVFFTFKMIASFIHQKEHVLNWKPTSEYFAVYYLIMQAMLPNGIKANHVAWFDIILNSKMASPHLKMVKVYINVKLAPEKMGNDYKKNLICRLQKEHFVERGDKERLLWCTHIISEYGLQSSFAKDLINISTSLLDLRQMKELMPLLKDQLPVQRSLIELVIRSKHMKGNYKLAEILCSAFKLTIEEFRELRRMKLVGSVLNLLQRINFNINKAEELVCGDKEVIDVMVAQLRKKGMLEEANRIKGCKGIIAQKNKLDDVFGPVTKPVDDHISLPDSVKVEFISEVEDIPKMECLVGAPMIGIDSEWRPLVTRWQKTKGVAIVQLSSETDTMVIDMIRLKDNQKLDTMMTRIMSHPNTSVLGFCFTADIGMYYRLLPNMSFYRDVPRLVEVMNWFRSLHPDAKGRGSYSLAKVCEKCMGMKLDKEEQMSNWENRPLRKSQFHYAALDAWILIKVAEELQTMDKKDGMDKFIMKQKTREHEQNDTIIELENDMNINLEAEESDSI